jgi:Na+-transporting methylmalonyl-CoA/oxaloacetate decarboxylase beta subunit
MLFGAAAQFGIFFTLSMASLFGFELKDAASIPSSARPTAPPPYLLQTS